MSTPSNLSRRQFLVRSAGIASASIGVRGAVGSASAAESCGDPLRVGVLGLGERGGQLLAQLSGIDGIRIVALADALPAARLRALELVRDGVRKGSRDLLPAGGPRLVSSAVACRVMEELHGKVDALVIATPPYLHREHALAALRAGFHVYLEKPMGLDVAEAEEIRDEAARAENRGQVFQVGLQRRYNPRYLAGIEAIRSGRAGRPLFVRAQWHSLGTPPASKAWFYRREHSGDLLLEQAIHQLDVCNWVFGGPPEKASGFGGLNSVPDPDAPERSVMDHCTLNLVYPGDSKVSFSHVSQAIPDRRFSGVYELVFCERMGVDLWNGLAWDRRGTKVSLGAQSALSGNDTKAALEGFVRHIRLGERSRADADVGYLATVTSLFGDRALRSESVLRWDEFPA